MGDENVAQILKNQQEQILQQNQQFQTLLQQQMASTALLASIAERFQKMNTCGQTYTEDQKLKGSVANSIHEFRYDPDNGVTFSTWYKRYEDIFLVDAENLDEQAKVRLLMQKLGPAEHTKYCNFILPKNPRELNLSETVDILCSIFAERTSLFNIRYNCLKIMHKIGEDIVTYAGRVNSECERFKLNDLSYDQFKALIFVAGLTLNEESDIRTRLLGRLDTNSEFTVQQLAEEYIRMQNIKQDTTMIQSAKDTSDIAVVDRISKTPTQSLLNQRARSQRPPTVCWKCGQWHFVKFCPFWNHVCQTCGRAGHLESRCFNKSPVRNPKQFRNQSNFVFTSCSENAQKSRRYITIQINHIDVTLQLDTASDITIISRKTWCLLGKPKYQPAMRIARNASGHNIPFVGEFHCDFKFRNNYGSGICYISNSDVLNLLGIEWIDQLKLWDVPLNSVCHSVSPSCTDPGYDVATISSNWNADCVDELERRFPGVFTDKLGKCEKFEAQLYVKPNVRPVFRPSRPVPYSLTELVDNELQRLEACGIISKVNYSSWAAPIVVVRKTNGTVRLCGDFSTGLNEALQTHQYPLPIPEDLFTRLNGGKVFTKIDLSDAYLQLPVQEQSKEVLTVNTHRGLYRYNRLPFGVKCAPAIFQQIMDAMLSGLSFAIAYMDDIIVASGTAEEHKMHLEQVLQRILEYGFTLRREKCEFFMRQVKYLGFIVDKEGRRPDPSKISAIRELPVPTNRTSLQSFLGLVNYYGGFIPKMHKLRAPLNELLRKDTKWNWSRECQMSFTNIKKILDSSLLLTHYDPKLPIIVAADASQYGIGAALLHEYPDKRQKAVCYASRALSTSERNYSQIEKEGLALVFAVKKFHKMLQGRKFTLYTDHQPLLSIFSPKKGIPVHTANRLQRWATLLIGYDFELRYIQTAKFGHVDALSRLIASHSENKPEEDAVIACIETDFDVKQVFTQTVRNLPVTSAVVRSETAMDPLLQQIKYYLLNGWPQKDIPTACKPFWYRRDSMTLVNDCLLFGERVVIPTSLQKRVIEQLHSGHPGVARMKAVARRYAYWPNIDKDIEEFVKMCFKCATAAKSPAKADLCPWPAAERPWSRVHVDFAGPSNGQYFLIIVDAYSKWPDVIPLHVISSQTTINALSHLFSQFGNPETL